MIRPTVVCLCGSTRFSDAFKEANLRETLAGKIVLSIGCDFKSDTDLLLAGELTQEDKVRLDELHLCKIDLADEVLFLNVGGYMGESTERELRYALKHQKRIRWLEVDGLNIYRATEQDWIQKYLDGRITEAALARLLQVDRLEARTRVERYAIEQGRRIPRVLL